MYIILRFLLNVTHLLYILYYFAQQMCNQIMLTIQGCKYLNKKDCNKSIINVKNTLILNSKFPKHLAILLGPEEISIIDIVKLISWCIIAEIPYVSFYDHKGVLQKNEIFIKKKLNELEPVIAQNVEWTNCSNNKVNNEQINNEINKNKSVCATIINTDTTDLINKSKTKIQIFSYSDGKEKIVNLTKSLAKIINLNILQENDITPDLIDKKLSLHVSIPDPEIAIIFGKAMCTYGFMPWQTRVTEFFVIPTHHGISSNHFVETLLKFSKCQQRYGK